MRKLFDRPEILDEPEPSASNPKDADQQLVLLNLVMRFIFAFGVAIFADIIFFAPRCAGECFANFYWFIYRLIPVVIILYMTPFIYALILTFNFKSAKSTTKEKYVFQLMWLSFAIFASSEMLFFSNGLFVQVFILLPLAASLICFVYLKKIKSKKIIPADNKDKSSQLFHK